MIQDIWNLVLHSTYIVFLCWFLTCYERKAFSTSSVLVNDEKKIVKNFFMIFFLDIYPKTNKEYFSLKLRLHKSFIQLFSISSVNNVGPIWKWPIEGNACSIFCIKSFDVFREVLNNWLQVSFFFKLHLF